LESDRLCLPLPREKQCHQTRDTAVITEAKQPLPQPGVTHQMSDVTDANKHFLDSEFRYILFSASYGIIFILGFLANCYVLFVLHRMRESKSIGEIRIYMTNLTVADLLFVCAMPFWVDYYSRRGDWIYPDFLCRVTSSMFFINTNCSILFLCAISINRYWAISRPLGAAASADRWRRGVVVSFVIWAVTLGVAVPSLVAPEAARHVALNHVGVVERNVTRCFEGYRCKTNEEKRGIVLTHFVITAVFFVVFLLVVVCNLLIARTLLRSLPGAGARAGGPASKVAANQSFSAPASARPQGVKRRALRMLGAVVGVFVLCFLPFHVVQGPWTLAVLGIDEGWGSVSWSLDTRQALNNAHHVALLLMDLKCILDPVVYCFATRKFRRFIVGHMK